MNQHRISIVDKKLVAQDTWEFTFQCLESRPLNIKAGQYMRIIIPEIAGGARENSRIFSIIMFRSSTSKHWGVVFRKSESAFKRYLINAPVGAELMACGPFGDFTLPECLGSRSLNMVWIAGGVGIAPFLSMARWVAEEKLPYRIVLFYANKDKESAAYLEELAALERENKNFTLRHKIGLLDEEFIKQGLENFSSVVSRQSSVVLFYIAGPIGMASEMKKILAGMGIRPEQIKCEIFG